MSTPWKVYDPEGQLQASCREPEAATCLVGLYGPRATIRWGNWTLWNEGKDGIASDGYSKTAQTIMHRWQEKQHRAYRRAFA